VILPQLNRAAHILLPVETPHCDEVRFLQLLFYICLVLCANAIETVLPKGFRNNSRNCLRKVFLPAEETNPLLENKSKPGLIKIAESFASCYLNSDLIVIRFQSLFIHLSLSQLA